MAKRLGNWIRESVMRNQMVKALKVKTLMKELKELIRWQMRLTISTSRRKNIRWIRIDELLKKKRKRMLY